MLTASCPEQALLRKYLDGSLPAENEALVVSHLDVCEGCRHILEQLADGSGALLAVAGRLGTEPADDLPIWEEFGARLSEIAEWSVSAERSSLLTLLGLPGHAGQLGRIDHFTLREIIGHGSMGVVFKAFDEKLERVVALKVLSPLWAAKATARERFLREARAAAAIRDEHVVNVYGVEESRDRPYLVLEFIDGCTLQDRLDRGVPPSLPEAIKIGRDVARGLAAAHGHGLIHRDVKPANILLDNRTSHAKITDFGLARAADDASITHDGVVVGTPQFMAPEQARGEPVDQRADLFGLGCVLYLLCTGSAPFSGNGTMAVLHSVVHDVPAAPLELNPEVPQWLDRLVMGLLAKNPAERIGSAQEVAELLNRRMISPALSGQETETFRPTRSHVRGETMRRRLVAAVLLVLAVVSLGVAESSGLTHLSATLIRVLTPDGMLSIAVDDPDVTISVEGEGGIVITGAGPREVRLRPGSYRLSAIRLGKTIKDELITITRGGKQVVTISRERSDSPKQAATVEILRGHVGIVWSAAFLPDGRRSLSCGADGTVRLWELQSGTLVHQFQHGAALSRVAVTPDGRNALSVGRNLAIKVWDLKAFEETSSFKGHEAPVQTVAISRDGRFALSGGDDKTIWLWNFATRTEKRCLRGHTGIVNSFAFVGDGRRAVSASDDTTVRLWNLETGEELRRYQGNTDAVHCATVSPDGRRVASGGRDTVIRIWDLENGELLRSLPDPSSVVSVAFSPDGSRLLSGGWSWAVRLWDVDSGEPIRTFEGHRHCVTCVTFSPDGRRALSCSYDQTIRQWQLPP